MSPSMRMVSDVYLAIICCCLVVIALVFAVIFTAHGSHKDTTPDAQPEIVLNGNPFLTPTWYVPQTNAAEMQSSIDSLPQGSVVRKRLEVMQTTPSAFWVDTVAKIRDPGGHARNLGTVEGILRDASEMSPPPLVTLVVYNLPNRDCGAAASTGEICCLKKSGPDSASSGCDFSEGGSCDAGLTEYETTYIDPLAAVLGEYKGKVPVVLLIEPDSLPNLATLTQGDTAHCGSSSTLSAYKQGVAYAVHALKRSCGGGCELYLDAAHGGWLGWKEKLDAYVGIVTNLPRGGSDSDSGSDGGSGSGGGLAVTAKIRGFTTNVANYQPLGSGACGSGVTCSGGSGGSGDGCCLDPCGVLARGNYANNELNFAQQLTAAFSAAVPGFDPRVVTDTGRNGVGTPFREDCGSWCNPRDAGAGLLPTHDTLLPDVLDAYFWVKTPGESDGCTETLPGGGGACPRFDDACSSEDSIGSEAGEPRAPEAGAWFDFQAKMLATNAAPWATAAR